MNDFEKYYMCITIPDEGLLEHEYTCQECGKNTISDVSKIPDNAFMFCFLELCDDCQSIRENKK